MGGRFRRRSLGEIDSARSRHMWTRSSVHVVDASDGAGDPPDELVVAGRWNGTVTAFDTVSLDPLWEREHPESAVGLATLGDALVVGGRGESGTIAAYDLETGARRWSYDACEDVGEPTTDSVFYRPYVVALDAGIDGDGRPTLYAAARRYERDGEERRWHSTVYAFDTEGAVRWRYETDASPIAVDLDDRGERLAVGYNRCTGDHDTGLVVLEAATGDPRWNWDPGTEGDRRVGDVSFDGDRLAVSSHGDKRGYLLEAGGAERWRVDLATETEIDGETLYAYPNHVYANGGRVAFVTGNTYAKGARETKNRHPNEHRLAVFDTAGESLWAADVRGFAHELDGVGDTVVVPCAQNFRVRDPTTHALGRFDLETGDCERERFDGIVTAAAVRGDTVAAIEEPVEYHDEGTVRGEYALHARSLRP